MKKSFIKCFLAVLALILLTSHNLFAQDNNKTDSEQGKIQGLIKYQGDSKPINLTMEEALKRSLDNNLNIKIKKEQIKEKQLKLDDVQKSRFFLFFKFVNPIALENSAKYSLQSSQYQMDATSNTVLLEVASKYYNLLNTIMAKKIADEFLKQGELSLNENIELLNTGHSTKFDVSQTEVFVAGLKQKELEAEIAYMVSSVELAQKINIKDLTTKIIPFPEANSDEVKIKTLNIIPDNVLLNDCINKALESRPEIKDYEYQIKSLEEMKKASKMDNIKVDTFDAQINQLKNMLELTQNNIKTSLTQSLLSLIGAKNQIEVANQKYQLSIKALNQAKITKEEGFNTNKNVLDAQVELALSKNKYIESVIAYNIAQINFLYQLGIININNIISNKLIEI